MGDDQQQRGTLILAVHYDRPLSEAKAYFESLGFRGIRGLTKDEPLINCNDARREVVAAAEAQGARWHFNGNYDANVGAACVIYRFWADVFPTVRG